MDLLLDVLGELFYEKEFFEEVGKLTFAVGLMANSTFPFFIRHRYREKYNVIHSLVTPPNFKSVGELLLNVLIVFAIYFFGEHIPLPIREEHIIIIFIISIVASFFDRFETFNEGIIIDGVYYYWSEIEGYNWKKNKLIIKPNKRKWNAIILRKRSWRIKKPKMGEVARMLKKHLKHIEI